MTTSTVVTTTFGGKTFRASKRTISHLKWTRFRLAARHPRARLRVIQGSYNTGVAASAGTHDYDAVLDVEIVGLDWLKAQAFLRACGWAAWWRRSGQWSSPNAWHIHMISIPSGLDGSPSEAEILAAYRRLGIRVGRFVPGQVRDYYRRATGLKGQHDPGSDHTWFPPNINKTVFRQGK